MSSCCRTSAALKTSLKIHFTLTLVHELYAAVKWWLKNISAVICWSREHVKRGQRSVPIRSNDPKVDAQVASAFRAASSVTENVEQSHTIEGKSSRIKRVHFKAPSFYWHM